MSEFKRTYSLVDIAERLRRPRTTLADWARQFKEFLPTVGSGRSMRYNEAALEVFGLISKMKDANEPPEYIREQLHGVVTEIIVPMTNDDEGKPYLMQLAGEVDQLKQAVVMLAARIDTMTTENDGLRRELDESRREAAVIAEQLRSDIQTGQQDTHIRLQEMTTVADESRREAAVATELLSGRITDVSDSFLDEIRKSEELTSEQLGEIQKWQQETCAQLGQISEQLSRVETYGKQRRGLFGKLFGKRYGV